MGYLSGTCIFKTLYSLQNQMSLINTLKHLIEEDSIFRPNQPELKNAGMLFLAVLQAFLNAVILAVTSLTHQFPPNCFHLLECVGSCKTAATCRRYNAGLISHPSVIASNFYCMPLTASFVIWPLKGIHSLFSDWVG